MWWMWIVGFVVLIGVLVVVMDRRGSTGAGKDYDELPRVHGNDRAVDPGYGPTGGGFGSDGGGGF
jgi:hypothetical protein